ncbi:PadR family transcriptional regulator [Kitasatospora sp. NA04385]|uniref:PadR family transcriptional regulator n=1 Tax=Kitasatospora sp. NA04385 TaxID=2742135 RepID=UPI001591B591|nr:PadR family transcriptional regulator [Kitasatospora sp. NA04385]QKW23711.1 PadR family transcriptional regulator [Kitasatospora sp. NA04385]
MRLPLLALLATGPAHGYQLRRALESTFGPAYSRTNDGQVYVTLGRLEKSGLIEGQDVAQDGRPAKRVFVLTDDGRRTLADWFSRPAEGGKVREEFFLKLVLAPHTRLADPRTLIDLQRSHCLATIRGLHATADQAPDHGVSRLLIEGEVLHLQAELDWLERCQQEFT